MYDHFLIGVIYIMIPVQLRPKKVHDVEMSKPPWQVQQNLRANVVSYGAAVAAAKAI